MLQFRCFFLLVCHIFYQIGPQYIPVYSNVDEPVESVQAVVHVPVLMSQLLLEEDLERFREHLNDVRKGDVLHSEEFGERPEVELCGFRLTVGGGDLLGTDPERFALHLSGLQKVFRHGIGIWHSNLEQFGRDHSLIPQQVLICVFQSVMESGKVIVFFDR